MGRALLLFSALFESTSHVITVLVIDNIRPILKQRASRCSQQRSVPILAPAWNHEPHATSDEDQAKTNIKTSMMIFTLGEQACWQHPPITTLVFLFAETGIRAVCTYAYEQSPDAHGSIFTIYGVGASVYSYEPRRVIDGGGPSDSKRESKALFSIHTSSAVPEWCYL